MDMCNIHMIILILRKTLFFGHDNRPWQLARDARPTVIRTDNVFGALGVFFQAQWKIVKAHGYQKI